MTIKELIGALNASCEENEICSIDDLSYDNLATLKKLDIQYITTVGRDEHRWYILGQSVYRVLIDGQAYYLGVWEVESLKSEMMSVSDCGHILHFFEMEQYTTVSYRVKENNND